MIQSLLQTDFIVTVFLFVFGSILLSNLLALTLNVFLRLFMLIRRID